MDVVAQSVGNVDPSTATGGPCPRRHHAELAEDRYGAEREVIVTQVMGIYVGQAGRRNFEVGRDAGTWGWRDDWPEPSRLQQGDLIVISQGGGGRLQLNEWIRRTASEVIVGRITQPRYVTEEPLWPDERSGEASYPYRVGFQLIGRSTDIPFRELPTSVNESMQTSATKQGRGFLSDLSADEEAQLIAAVGAADGGSAPGDVESQPEPEPSTLEPAAGWDPPSSAPTSVPAAPDLDWLVETTLWTRERLEEVVETLADRRSQIVLAGPPGTGKTWVARQLAHYLAEGRQEDVFHVQFHPSYGYEDFVVGLRPVPAPTGLVFETVKGPLLLAAEHARETGRTVVLVIDEMNRANLPLVFGELIQLMEYRDHPVRLVHLEHFTLPSNLVIIGTMNTADRSIRSVDVAIRRRFDFFECPPDPALLERFYSLDNHHSEVAGLAEGMVRLNEAVADLLDRHHAVGHTYFMSRRYSARDLVRTWDRQILPLIEEYLFDQPDLVEDFSLERFWPGLTT
jgi:MoxR-like ATPase